VKAALTSLLAPKAVGTFLPRSGLAVAFISGQVLRRHRPDDRRRHRRTYAPRARQHGALLQEAGLTFDHLVRTTVFLADMNDFSAMNEAYRGYFTEPYPARSTVQAARLPRDARIEIDAIALFP
jgi:reactive intermediate/imine deaminase